MKTYTQKDLQEILDNHKLWLSDPTKGKRADLSYSNLSYSNLSKCDLRGSNLSGSNLRGSNLSYSNLSKCDLSKCDLRDCDLSECDLRGSDLSDSNLRGSNLRDSDLSDSDLRGSNLRGSNLRGSNLSDSDLRDSDLRGSNLRGSNLRGSNLRGSNLNNVYYDGTTSFLALQCPEEESFIGYKKASNYIIKLEITEDAKRSSATSRKCRCNKALVLGIYDINKTLLPLTSIASDHDDNFIYQVGQIVEVKDFNENRWIECASGIHFFITFNEAKNY